MNKTVGKLFSIFQEDGKFFRLVQRQEVDAHCVNDHFTTLLEFKIFVDNLELEYLESITSFGQFQNS